MYKRQNSNPFRPGIFVGRDVAVAGVRGLKGRSVKTQLGVVVYMAVPQLHQEVGDIPDAPSVVHVRGVWVDAVVAGTWEDCAYGVRMGPTTRLVRVIDVEIVPNPLGDVASKGLSPAVAGWRMPQPEVTPPAPITGTQPT